MASIRREIAIRARPEDVWAAVRDIGAIHTRLAPGFVVDTALEDGARVVTFGNGMVVREVIVALDDAARRLAWSARSGRLTHHNASMQVFAEGPGQCRAVWIADLLPDAAAGPVAAMIDQGMAAMKAKLEGAGTPR
ncbi:MAG: SRPBCC family protein [Proteobacteria bacterium]|nr:SRPBCC family protein [Pseudomonadota bacterium]